MSVHSLPEAKEAVPGRTRIGRLKMLLIWAVCAAPVAASYFTYYVLRPQSRANYGTLISPPRSLPPSRELPMADMQGRAVAPDALKGQWLLIVVAGGACNAQCEQHLYAQRQLREMLGRDKDRMDRVWLVTDDAPVRPALMPALKEGWILRADAGNVSRWLTPEAGHSLDAHLYLVDPHGDWMMRFPADADPDRVKKDLVRLMKASESWDLPGR